MARHFRVRNMATPKLVSEQRRLWPDSPGNCRDGHIGPFSLTSHVPRYHSCHACGEIVKPTDKLAHSVFMDPSIDPYDICGGGSGGVGQAAPDERFASHQAEVMVCAVVILIAGGLIFWQFW